MKTTIEEARDPCTEVENELDINKTYPKQVKEIQQQQIMDKRIQLANVMDRKLEQEEREVDIIADQTWNALLQQLLVQIHKDTTITPTTVCDKYVMLLPKEEDDSFGGFYNEEDYIEFQKSLSPDRIGKHTSIKRKVNYTNSIYNKNIINEYNLGEKYNRNVRNNTMWYNNSRNKKWNKYRSRNIP